MENKIKKFDAFVLISDIHLGVHSDSLEWLDNIEQYFINFFVPNVKKVAEECNIGVIIAGDVFDNRHRIDINVMNVAHKIFNSILSINNDIEIFCIPGNHDLYKKGPASKNVSSLVCLNIDRFNVINDVTLLSLKNNIKLLMVPWIGDPKEENQILKDNPSDIVIMHTEIAGAEYDNGQKIINGVNTTLTNAKRIYSGHIHKRQESKNRIYIGSPYQTTRGDMGNKKGLYFIYLNDNGFTDKFIENNYSPEFIKITSEQILNNDYEKYLHNYVDIIINDNELKNTKISKFVNSVKDLNFKKAEILVEHEKHECNIEEMPHNISIDEFIEKYINEISDLTKKDKTTLLKINKTYIDKCNEMDGN